MSRFTIIVAPWGNPFGWRQATYSLLEEGRRITVRDKNTSLACLVKALRPDRVILIIPETVLCPGDKYIENFCRRGGQLLSEILEEGKGELYPKALESLEQVIRNLYKEWEIGGPDPYIVVAPAIGEYKCKDEIYVWKIGLERVDPVSAYAAFTLVSVVATAIDLKMETPEEVLLVLDTTHGINYMPLAAYRATMVAARILSTILNTRVEFRQYNSAPYPFGASKPVTLDIFMVRRETITPNKAAQRLVYSYLVRNAGQAKPFLRARDLGDILHRRLNKIEKELGWLKDLHREVCALVASIHFSMPLALLQLGLEYNLKYGKIVEEGGITKFNNTLRELLGYVQVCRDTRGRLNIEHQVMPRYDDIKSLLAAISLTSYSNHAVKYVNPVISQGLVEASLDDLEKTAENWLRGPLLGVVRHEISMFKKAYRGEYAMKEVKELINRAETEKSGWVSLECGCESSTRIYIAHAGLASNSIEVKIDKNNVYIRYCKHCLNTIRNCLCSALSVVQELIRGTE